MKSTYSLYNLDPSDLIGMPYEKALEKKIVGADFAMRQYKSFAEKERLFSNEYKEWLKKYEASRKARDFTLEQLAELNE